MSFFTRQFLFCFLIPRVRVVAHNTSNCPVSAFCCVVRIPVILSPYPLLSCSFSSPPLSLSVDVHTYAVYIVPLLFTPLLPPISISHQVSRQRKFSLLVSSIFLFTGKCPPPPPPLQLPTRADARFCLGSLYGTRENSNSSSRLWGYSSRLALLFCLRNSKDT